MHSVPRWDYAWPRGLASRAMAHRQALLELRLFRLERLHLGVDRIVRPPQLLRFCENERFRVSTARERWGEREEEKRARCGAQEERKKGDAWHGPGLL